MKSFAHNSLRKWHQLSIIGDRMLGLYPKILSKLATGLLVFSFVLQPLSVFAQESSASSPAPSTAVTPVPTSSLPPPSFSIDPSSTIPPPQGEVLGETTETPLEGDPDEEIKPEEEIPPPMALMGGGSSDLPNQDWSKDDERRFIPQADSFAGAYSYQYQFKLPPGRNGLTPSLTLYYNNQSAEDVNWFGYGWNLDIPYIERLNKTGTNNLFSEKYFSSTFDGELATTSASTTLYGAKIENGSFRTYSYGNSAWIVTDKTGTQYRFGNATTTRIDNSASTTQIYRWMLDEVRDKNGNYIKYEYTKDSGYIYPSKVTYTGNGVTDGIFEVSFSRITRNIYGTATSSRAGFEMVAKKLTNQVQIKVNGILQRQYDLTYTVGDNGSRYMLDTITETGKDESGVDTILPATTFDYSDDSANAGWGTPQLGKIPVAFIKGASVDTGLRVADVNGDGLGDFIWSEREGTSSTTNKIYINDGNLNWNYNSAWVFPVHNVIDGNDQGVRLADINGDLLIDVLWAVDDGAGSTTKKAYLNTGSGWALSSTWTPPEYFMVNNKDNGARIADVNGDGLADIVYANSVSGTVTNKIYLNNGAGWTEHSTWKSPMTFSTDGVNDGSFIFDINNDGLYDFMTATTTYLNTGSGWNNTTSFNPVVSFTKAIRYADVTGDNLVDVVIADGMLGGDVRTLKNDGQGWPTADYDWHLPDYFTEANGKDLGIRLADVDGDGVIDDLYSGTTTNMIRIGNGIHTDLLVKVTNDKGGITTITYNQTPLYRSGSGKLINANLPIILDTVSNITKQNGVNTTESVDFSYAGGLFYYGGPYDRRLAGFASTTRTNALGYQTRTYYHQGSTTDGTLGEYNDHISKIGKPYRVEIVDGSGNVYSKKINKWENVALNYARNFVKLTQAIDWAQDGDADSRHKAETYDYDDSTGNLSRKTSLGEVTATDAGGVTDTGTDKFVTTYLYSTSSDGVVNLPEQETLKDNSGNKVSERKFYYDTQSLGVATLGNLTKDERWVDTSTTTSIQRTYNSYGLVTQETDPRGKNTTFTYDTYNLYPATTTNAISQTFGYQYDYTGGKVKISVDPNNRVFQTVYDGLDRPLQEKQPSTTTPGTLVTKSTYTYTDNTVPLKIQKSDYLDASNIIDTYSYFDGFGRLLQERRETEDPNNYTVKELIYNSIGLLDSEMLPYFSTGSGRTSTTTASSLYITYAYDPLERVTKITNAVGSTTNVYDDWKLTVTDPLFHTKKLYKDAYDNLTQVDELNGASTYSTTYTYNGLGNLTKITDAAGNIRNFTYDGVGRRLNAQDLHASADTTFGSTTYTYDAGGNLTRKIDPKNQTVNYTYDNINRVTSEDYTGIAGTEVQYGYDGCGNNGKGQLCSATSTGAVVTYTYDPLGRLATEIKTVNTNAFTTTYDYDRQGNILSLVYPDSSEVQYTYNNGGQVETVSKKEPPSSTFTNVVNDFDYSPMGQVSYVSYANFTESILSYDPFELYRLKRKITTKLAGAGGSYDLDEGPGIFEPDQFTTNEKGDRLLKTPIEREELRNANSQTFVSGYTPAGDEIRMAKVYSGKEFYADRYTNGYEPIDTQLEDLPEGWLMTKAPYHAALKNKIEDNLIIFENGKEELSISLPKATTTSKSFAITKNQSDPDWANKEVLYKDILGQGIDMRVRLNNESLIKEFIINDRSALPNLEGKEFYEIPFDVTSDKKLDVEVDGKKLSEEKEIVSHHTAQIVDENGDSTYVWPPFVNDSYKDDTHLTPISIKYEMTEDGLRLTKLIPVSWLLKKTTLYPVVTDATLSPFSGAPDGSLTYDDASWTTARNGSNATINQWTLNRGGIQTAKFDDEPDIYRIQRGFFSFDTSALGSNATVTSASLYSYRYNMNGNIRMALVQPSPLATTSLQDADYGRMTIDSPPEGAARKWAYDWLTGTYTRWDLSATGTSWISATSTTWLAVRTEQDVDNSVPALGDQGGPVLYFSEESGTSKDPYLEITYVNASSTDVLQDLTYTYDKVGNITKMQDKSGTNTKKTVDYQYDDLNRLIAATSSLAAYGSNYTHTFTYDSLGNITNKSDKGAYLYEGNTGSLWANPHAVTKVGGVTYTYDNNGNLLGNGSATSTWDYNDRITQIAKATSTMKMAYDHAGSRVKYQVGTVTTYYPNMYYDVTATTTKDKHIYANNMLLASVQATGTATTTNYVYSDHLGGSTIVANASSTIVETNDYFPFGEVRFDQKAGSYTESKKLLGKHEYDPETSLNYMMARYQDGRVGRFYSEDPSFLDIGDANFNPVILSNPQALNSYSYANNNPLINGDPDGKSAETFVEGAATGLAVTAVIGLVALTAPITLPAAAITGIAVAGTAAVGYGTYSNYKAYSSGKISKDEFDYNAGSLLGGLALPTGLGKAAQLENLTLRPTAIPKLEKVASYTGQAPRDLLISVRKSGIKYVDTREKNYGNVNYYKEIGNEKYARVSTNSARNAIVGVGFADKSQVRNLVTSGQLRQLNSLLTTASNLLSKLSGR